MPQSDIAGKYVVQRLLASGGMSQVYLARQKSLEREIALKVVFLDPSDTVSVEALRNEAFLAGRVQHPHIVSVVDHGEAEGGILYLAMELLHGASLAETLFHSASSMDNGSTGPVAGPAGATVTVTLPWTK